MHILRKAGTERERERERTQKIPTIISSQYSDYPTRREQAEDARKFSDPIFAKAYRFNIESSRRALSDSSFLKPLTWRI